MRMNGNDLPENDHIVRYVKPRNVEDGQVSIAEFRLRENEKGVSVNWLEYYENLSKKEQLAEVRVASRLVLRKNGKFAELNVGRIKDFLAEELLGLRVVHTPLDAEEEFPADPSHSEITGLPSSNSEQADLIAEMIAKCVCDFHPAIAE